MGNKPKQGKRLTKGRKIHHCLFLSVLQIPCRHESSTLLSILAFGSSHLQETGLVIEPSIVPTRAGIVTSYKSSYLCHLYVHMAYTSVSRTQAHARTHRHMPTHTCNLIHSTISSLKLDGRCVKVGIFLPPLVSWWPLLFSNHAI